MWLRDRLKRFFDVSLCVFPAHELSTRVAFACPSYPFTEDTISGVIPRKICDVDRSCVFLGLEHGHVFAPLALLEFGRMVDIEVDYLISRHGEANLYYKIDEPGHERILVRTGTTYAHLLQMGYAADGRGIHSHSRSAWINALSLSLFLGIDLRIVIGYGDRRVLRYSCLQTARGHCECDRRTYPGRRAATRVRVVVFASPSKRSRKESVDDSRYVLLACQNVESEMTDREAAA